MKYGCIGEHLAHSFSREIHHALTDKYKYELKEIPRDGLDAFMRGREFEAINVTIPYKRDVIPYLDFIAPEAKAIGAVNTIVKKDGKLFGYNTDFSGMRDLAIRTGIDMSDKKVLILGSGGTSSTASAVAKSLGAKEVIFVSRGAGAREGFVDYDGAYALHSDAEIIINATPCGMYPEIFACPIDVSRFPRLCGVVDAIYNPLRSELVLNARSRGIKACGGLYMLVAQAAYAVEKFTGEDIGRDKIESVYKKILSDKENIVLVGMPGSGKSTLGRELARRLGRRFIDTDEEIVAREGREIPKIIERDGEAEFRKIETETIRSIASTGSCVVATGGGAILSQTNVDCLRRNGKLIFIDCPIELIVPTGDRPLSSTREMIGKRYAERYEIYKSVADGVVATSKNLMRDADAVTEEFYK